MSEDGGSTDTLVDRAVIPVAGLGTRMFPITKIVPKEMLPVGKKPMIQLALEELYASGVKKIAIVIRQGKEIIEEYLLSKYSYSYKQDKSITELEELVSDLEIFFLFQEAPTGLGGALLVARDFVGDNPFIMLIPDQLVYATIPATRQLVENCTPNSPSMWSSLIQLPKEEAPYFVGSRVIEFERLSHRQVKIKRILSEGEASLLSQKAQFEIRGIGRTILPPTIFDYLASERIDPTTGEIDYVKAVETYTKSNPHYGVLLEGTPFDLGTFEGYYRYLPQIQKLMR